MIPGIRYITNEDGHKTDIVISLKDHGSIVEDLLDALLIEERKNEDSVPFDVFVKQLKEEGKLHE